MASKLKNTFLYCLGVILVALIFEIISLAINSEIIAPSIFSIISNFFNLLKEASTYLYLANTLLELLIAIVIASLIGIALGAISGLRPSIYKVLKPLMSFLRILPIIIFVVLLMLLADLSLVPIMATTLILIPMIYEGTYQGIISVDRDIVNAYKIDTKFNFRVFNRIYLPLISKTLKTALINALGIGIKVIVTTEYICGANNTLGKAIIDSMVELEYANIYGYSIILIVVIIMLELLPKLIARLIGIIANKPIK